MEAAKVKVKVESAAFLQRPVIDRARARHHLFG
jgi:hypothetical protein